MGQDQILSILICFQALLLEKNQIIDARFIAYKSGLDYYKVNRTINKYVNLGILKVSNISKKNRTYIYEDYVEILKK